MITQNFILKNLGMILSIQKWNINLNNVNDLFLDFHHKLKGCVDMHAPIKQLTRKEVKLANKPWITPAII